MVLKRCDHAHQIVHGGVGREGNTKHTEQSDAQKGEPTTTQLNPALLDGFEKGGLIEFSVWSPGRNLFLANLSLCVCGTTSQSDKDCVGDRA